MSDLGAIELTLIRGDGLRLDPDEPPVTDLIAEGWQATSFGTPVLSGLENAATGFSSTAFSEPAGWQHFNTTALEAVVSYGVPTAALTLSAQGWLTLALGHPFVNEPAFVDAESFSTTALGAPAARFNQTGVAVGASFAPTYGAAVAYPFQRANIWVPVTTFGTPFIEMDLTCAAVGFRPTRMSYGHLGYLPRAPIRHYTFSGITLGRVLRFGTPNKNYVATNETRTAATLGQATQLGSPRIAALHLTGEASAAAAGAAFGTAKAHLGIAAIHLTGEATPAAAGATFGTAQAHLRMSATAIEPVAAFGEPGYTWRVYPTGVRGTMFGTPRGARAYPVSKAVRRARFGTPRTTAFSGEHRALGFSRFSPMGQPRAYYGRPCLVEGWQTTTFGAPEVWRVQRALHTAPTVRFGAGLVRRPRTQDEQPC